MPAATPTPIPAAAPAVSTDDVFLDGVSVVYGSDEEVGKDVVAEGLEEAYSWLAPAHHVSFGD